MSQHGCPERLSNRSKGFQEEGPSDPTMEVLVETLTGTALQMTVSPSDTIFEIKSKIFRVEGIPVSQQHILYNLVELDDSSCLGEHSITDGARLRLVLGLRGGPISTRRLPPPPPPQPWRDIERLLDNNREECSGGCKVTVVVVREGECVNMMRVRENADGTYSPLTDNEQDNNTLSCVGSAQWSRESVAADDGLAGSVHENAVTMGKMMELRRRLDALSLQRNRAAHRDVDNSDTIQKTRSEEILSVPSLLDDAFKCGEYAAYGSPDDSFAPRLYGDYARYEYDCALERCGGVAGGARVRALGGPLLRAPPPAARYASHGQLPRAAAPPPALTSASTGDLQRAHRLLPALARHHNSERLHASDEGLHLQVGYERRRDAPEPKKRARCGLCRKKLSIATAHACRCGGAYCAPHRYAEVHGCAYDYKAAAGAHLQRANPLVSAPKLPKI